ncbi:hypothetical protein CLOM_g20886 [Closterium sp. NIES-68]|nr:hypothetical protein CLOM_g20886 [Closterium sp. NIES-68]GJP68490.1 hypothetical protein CLOP_g25190 [Closterium sp. NIES-67]
MQSLDDGDDFRLPIDHRITENLDREGLEMASLDKPIACSNVGFQLLLKMGWRGKGLGRNEQGIVDPVRTEMRDARLGLGKQEEEEWYTAEENVQRRKLEVEVEETEEMAKKREEEAERVERIRADVKEIQKVFLCELCNKQYKLASEMETHLSSYDHNHKKRFQDTKKMQQLGVRDERQRREQLREEREMARYAKLVEAQKQQQGNSGLAPAAPAPAAAAPAAAAAIEAAASAAAAPQPAAAATSAISTDRSALKFGLSMKSKPGAAKKGFFGKSKPVAPPKKLASVFGAEEDEEEAS